VQRRPALRFGNQHIQPGIGKATASGAAQHERLFQRVSLVAQLLHRLTELRAEHFAEFFQAAQRFLQTLGVGREHVRQRGPLLFLRRADCRADVMHGVARANQQVAGRQRERLRQAVAKLLQLAGEESVGEREASVIFQHAQRFAGPVGAGVHDAGGVGWLLGVLEQDRRVHHERRSLLRGALPERGVI
jgi:hypothetical protein